MFSCKPDKSLCILQYARVFLFSFFFFFFKSRPGRHTTSDVFYIYQQWSCNSYWEVSWARRQCFVFLWWVHCRFISHLDPCIIPWEFNKSLEKHPKLPHISKGERLPGSLSRFAPKVDGSTLDPSFIQVWKQNLAGGEHFCVFVWGCNIMRFIRFSNHLRIYQVSWYCSRLVGCGEPLNCYWKVAGLIPLVCKCSWARYWTPNCFWCAWWHLAWQPPPSLHDYCQFWCHGIWLQP